MSQTDDGVPYSTAPEGPWEGRKFPVARQSAEQIGLTQRFAVELSRARCDPVRPLSRECVVAVLTVIPAAAIRRQWLKVSDLVRIGVLLAGPADAADVEALADRAYGHALVHLKARTQMTVESWYDPSAVSTTLSKIGDVQGPDGVAMGRFLDRVVSALASRPASPGDTLSGDGGRVPGDEG